MDVIHWGMYYPHQQKMLKYCPTASSGSWVWNNSGVLKLKLPTKGSAPASIIPYETKSLNEIC
jgi:hypothetical protein